MFVFLPATATHVWWKNTVCYMYTLVDGYIHCSHCHLFSLAVIQVIDPDIPPKGLNINGERIQAPSDEVMELREKNSNAIYLVRFFDGRRTWYVEREREREREKEREREIQ